MPLPRLVVVFGYRSLAAFEILAGLQGIADVIWLIDGSDDTAAAARPLLVRTGPVVDALGLDPRQAAAALREHQPNGIVTFYDTGMARIAAIASELGLRFHSVATGRALEDKLEQRMALAAAGIDSPQVTPLPADRAELLELSETIRYPAVVKPRNASGSWRTARVDSPGALVAIWDELSDAQGRVAGDRPDDFLVEDYLPDGPELPGGFEGDYVSVETVATNGELSHLAVTGRFPLVSPFRETGYFIPATIDDGQRTAAIELAGAALRGIGFCTGCAHTELKLTDTGWRVIEINGRIGGGVPDMLRIATGLELISLTAQAALGVLEPLAPPTVQAVGYRFFYQPPPGRHRVISIDGLDGVKAIPGIESIVMHHTPGAEVDSRDGTRTYLLAIVGVAEDHAAVREVESAIKSAVRVEYETLESGPEPQSSVEVA